MHGLRTAATVILLITSAYAAHARIIGNGPEQPGARLDSVVGILSIDLRDAHHGT